MKFFLLQLSFCFLPNMLKYLLFGETPHMSSHFPLNTSPFFCSPLQKNPQYLSIIPIHNFLFSLGRTLFLIFLLHKCNTITFVESLMTSMWLNVTEFLVLILRNLLAMFDTTIPPSFLEEFLPLDPRAPSLLVLLSSSRLVFFSLLF